MKTYKYLFAFLFLLLGWSCSKDEIDTTGNIVGIITDARTGEALSNASVTINPLGKTATTGTDGRYEFRNIQAQDYSVQAQKTNYQTVQKSVTVNPGEDSQLDFSLTPSAPVLAVSQSTFDFGNDATTLSFDLSNDGHSELDWYISEDITWLSCTPPSGKIQAKEKTSIVINVDRKGLDKGYYTQTFAISSNGGSCVVTVKMAIQGTTVSVIPEDLDFGALTTVLPLTLKNTGAQPASYTLNTQNEWIILNATDKSGKIAAGSSRQMNVTINRTSLSEGDYSGKIVLALEDKEIDILVKMNIPAKSKPTVHLSAVTDVSYSEAKFNGAVVSIGSSKIIRHGFAWGTTENPTIDNAQTCNFGTCAESKEFSHQALSLQPDATYYVRAYAENSEGISYSNQEKFVTSGVPSMPNVTTGTVSDVQSTQAKVTGNIVGLGNLESVSQHGHVWSTKANPTIADSKTSLGEKRSTGSFVSSLTGLQPNATYHVRAYATNKKGTAYGEDILLTTNSTTIPDETLTFSGTVTSIRPDLAVELTGVSKQNGILTVDFTVQNNEDFDINQFTFSSTLGTFSAYDDLGNSYDDQSVQEIKMGNSSDAGWRFDIRLGLPQGVKLACRLRIKGVPDGATKITNISLPCCYYGMSGSVIYDQKQIVFKNLTWQ